MLYGMLEQQFMRSLNPDLVDLIREQNKMNLQEKCHINFIRCN